jgi:hypothetical protein
MGVLAILCFLVSSGPVADEIKWRGIQERADSLKEKTFRLKERIRRMEEILMNKSFSAGTGVALVHRNELGAGYRLLSAVYLLDGRQIPVDAGSGWSDLDEKTIFEESLQPGRHRIAVRLVLQATGYGFFPYAEGYKFQIQSSFQFDVEQGKMNRIDIVGFERDAFLTAFEERPAIRYEIRTERLGAKRASDMP